MRTTLQLLTLSCALLASCDADLYGGQIYEVSAILGRAESSGWD